VSAWTTAVAALTTPSMWWRLGEASGTTLADASGNSRAGTLSGSTIGYGVTGPLGGDSDTAMSFTGTNPVGQIAYAAWQEATQFTVSVWFKAGTLGATNALAGRDHQSGGRRFQLTLNSSGNITATIILSGGSASTITSPSTYADGAWHLVTFVYDQTLATGSKQKLYVDGSSTPVVTGGNAASINVTGTAVPFSVGNLTRTTQSPANSSLDELLYWSGTPLSGADHLSLHAAASSTPQVDAPLTGSGAFSALVVPVIALAASLTGTGVFSAAVVEVEQTAANLAGSGAFTAAAFPSHDRTASLTGSGAFSAAVQAVTGLSADLTGSGAFTATTVEVEYAAADLTGTGSFTADVAASVPVVADFTGTGSFTATRVVVGEEDWVDLDLSTAVFRYTGATPRGAYDDGVIMSAVALGSGAGPRFWFPDLIFGTDLDYAESYEFEVTFTDDATWTYLWVEAHPDNSDASFDSGPLELLIDDVGIDGPPPTEFTFTIGPGIYGWDDAVADDYVGMTFELTNQAAVSGLRYRVAPESDGEVDAHLTGHGAFTAVRVVVGVIETDTSNDDDGIYLGDGYAQVIWEPDVVEPPFFVGPLTEDQVRTAARVIDTAPGALPSYATAVARQVYAPAARDRVLIDGVDFTYWNGAAVQVENMKLIDPLLYGGARITLPGINPQFPDAELGDLVTRFRFARVKIQRVLDGEVISTDSKGFVSRVDTSGTTLSLEVGGEAAGALSQMYVPPAVFRRKQDVEHICADLLRDARVQAKEHDGTSGVGLIKRGGSDGLTIFNETVAVWAGATGQAVTWTPNADGVYRKTQKSDTIVATAYIDSSLVSQSLAQDFMEQYTRVYARGFTANGEIVTNIKTPGLDQGDAPDFPLASGTLSVGMDDGDTTSGAGVTAAQQQLAIHNFLDFEDTTNGTFDALTERAVEAFQEVAGLNVTGEIGENTWDALWNLEAIG
jgi:hypothetical protein